MLITDFLYAIPLIIAMSLVYSGTRHEQMKYLLPSAVNMGMWIVGFLAGFYVLMFILF